MAQTPEERSTRARLAAYVLHTSGGTNTATARAAYRAQFEAQVDPDGTLPPDERAKRARSAFGARMARIALDRHLAERAKRATDKS